MPLQETAEQYSARILGNIEGKKPLVVQRTTATRLKDLTRRLTPKQLRWKPAPDKWSIAEIAAHLADAEIVGSWRLRSIAGANGTTVQAFDQNAWVSVFDYNKRDVKQSIELFRVLRENNLSMLKALPKAVWDNYGMHQERGKETVAHLTRLYAGHDLNHLRQIETIVAQLKKRK